MNLRCGAVFYALFYWLCVLQSLFAYFRESKAKEVHVMKWYKARAP
jgi:hypothetical protein